MLTTLLDPSQSSFINNSEAYFKEDAGTFKTMLCNTEWYFTQTGEPHLVTLSSLSSDELTHCGYELNTYRSLFPQGISLNTVRVLDSATIEVTTFERGVNKITRSCGTGSTCAALLADHMKLVTAEQISVLTSGGMLTIVLTALSTFKIGPASIDFLNPSYLSLENNHE